jgi:predicted secreted protein
MTASPGMTGYGLTFEVRGGPDTSDAYAFVSNLLSMTPPSSSVDVIDVTNSDSADSLREFIQGFTDPGECAMGLLFDPGGATTDRITDWRSSREVRQCKITWPDGTIWEFYGFVSGFEIDAPFDDKMTATLTVKVTGVTTIS